MIDEAMSPLRRRMIEDMTIRKFRAAQHDDLQWVKNFATHWRSFRKIDLNHSTEGRTSSHPRNPRAFLQARNHHRRVP